MAPAKSDDVRRLENAGYLSIYRTLVRSYTCPLWWYDDTRPIGAAILHNGTATFINTGAETLMVTAEHVYSGYEKNKSENPAIKCQVGNVTVELELYLIDSNRSIDLATFRLPAILTSATGATVHSCRRWPPEPLKEGELAMLGGYPGNRRLEGSGTLQTDFVHLISRVAQSSSDHISFQLELQNSLWATDRRLENQPDLGGLSGGPIFRHHAELIEALEFVGIIYEVHQSYELIFARHAECINRDGSLTR